MKKWKYQNNNKKMIDIFHIIFVLFYMFLPATSSLFLSVQQTSAVWNKPLSLSLSLSVRQPENAAKLTRQHAVTNFGPTHFWVWIFLGSIRKSECGTIALLIMWQQMVRVFNCDVGDQDNNQKIGFSVKVFKRIWLRRLEIVGAKGEVNWIICQTFILSWIPDAIQLVFLL